MHDEDLWKVIVALVLTVAAMFVLGGLLYVIARAITG